MFIESFFVWKLVYTFFVSKIHTRDAISRIKTEKVPTAVTKKVSISDQPGIHLRDVAAGSRFVAEPACNSISLEKERGTSEIFLHEEDKPRDMDKNSGGQTSQNMRR